MDHAHEFLKALSIVLGVAGVTTLAFQRLRLPVVLGYLLAGLIVGPYLPVPLVADRTIVQTLSELGVILLMFSLGLEFRVRKLVAVGPTAGVAALVESSAMLWLGFVVGRAFGWTVLQSVFVGAIVAISSTTIVVKAFDELAVRGRVRDLVVGILIVEDLVAIVILAVLTAVTAGATVSPGALGATIVRLGAFLASLLVVGMLVVPRAVRFVRSLDRPETLLIASLGLCFAIAYVAFAFGYSVALGAFVAGSLVAESGEEREVARLVAPVRDVFAAIFFVSVGMLIDPALVRAHWFASAVLFLVVVVGKIGGVTIGSFLTGMGARTSIQAGMSLAQIGEFSFILAALGASLQDGGDLFYPIAVTVSAATTLTTPWLIRASGPVASYIDRKLPRPVQTIATLYGSWVEQVRASRHRRTLGGLVRRLVRVILLDAVLVSGLIIGTSLVLERAARVLAQRLALDGAIASAAVIVLASAAAAPFVIGLVRNGRRLGVALAAAAVPRRGARALDLGAAPRRALLSLLELATTLAVLLPIVVVTQPFLPRTPGAVALAIALVVLGVVFWRSAAGLQGHVRAGAQVIVEVLAKQGAAPSRPEDDALATFRAMFPGLGEPVVVQLRSGSPAVGGTLSTLAVRGVTGASVLAISRPGHAVMMPTASEVLRAGDVLALAGTAEAIDGACQLLGAERLSVTAAPGALPAGPPGDPI